jgi:hypothetical protein
VGGHHDGPVNWRFRSASRAMTLLALRESRLPVGSSARHDGRIIDQRPGNGGTLHFSAGELARLVAEAISQAEPAEQFPRPSAGSF